MSADRQKKWRTVARRGDGKPVLRSPDGREYEGTVAEVRAEGMAPWRRRMLADEIGVAWRITKPGSEERAWIVAERRRDAIRYAAFDKINGFTAARLPSSLAILAEAAARFMGQDFDEFVAEAVEAQIQGARDVCQQETGTYDLPLTRHERAALERLGSPEGGAA